MQIKTSLSAPSEFLLSEWIQPGKQAEGEIDFLGTTLLASSLNWGDRTVWFKSLYYFLLPINNWGSSTKLLSHVIVITFVIVACPIETHIGKHTDRGHFEHYAKPIWTLKFKPSSQLSRFVYANSSDSLAYEESKNIQTKKRIRPFSDHTNKVVWNSSWLVKLFLNNSLINSWACEAVLKTWTRLVWLLQIIFSVILFLFVNCNHKHAGL